ncbi:hypothetical protein ACIOK4_30215 [Streptomyces bottropensis]|uniref:hypothetical protein n=1 Tax=Streptomyces bottropensis TaxID=42235 RepID=UPI00380AE27D
MLSVRITGGFELVQLIGGRHGACVPTPRRIDPSAGTARFEEGGDAADVRGDVSGLEVVGSCAVPAGGVSPPAGGVVGDVDAAFKAVLPV